MRLAQIQFSFESTARFVRQLILAVQIIDMLSLGVDQFEIDLVLKFGKFVAAVGIVTRYFGSQQSRVVSGAKGFEGRGGKSPLARTVIQEFGGLPRRLPPGVLLRDTIGAALSAPCVGEAERTHDPWQSQALANERDEDDAERQKED